MLKKVFTKEELAQYDGKRNEKKYVAIDGVVYDLTPIAAWSDKMHHGNTPGQDLSEMIVKAPHKKAVLDKLEAVGIYEA